MARIVLVILIVFCLVISSCVPSSTLPAVTEPTNDLHTPTPQPPTATPVPTSTSTATPTIEPTINFKATKISTPTIVAPAEWDLNPAFEKHINVEWGGVMISAGIIIDASVSPFIEKMEIPDAVLAEIIARSVYSFWLRRHYPELNTWSSWMKDEYDVYFSFDRFMQVWAEAQKSGEPSDWRKVQLNNVWANDMTDGDGYAPERYHLWPMHNGETPEGLTSLSEIILVWVVPSQVENLYYDKHLSIEKDAGRGYNLNGGTLLIYYGHSFQPSDCHEKWRMSWSSCIAETIYLDLGWGAFFLSNNYGGKPIYCQLTGAEVSPSTMGLNNYLYRLARSHLTLKLRVE